MDLRKPTTKTTKRSLDKSNASNSNTKKRPTSASKKNKHKDNHNPVPHNNVSVIQSFANDKKKGSKLLSKKKI